MRVNFHTHTTRCGHAKGTDEEYVEAAIAAGIQVLGFSDHIPWPTEFPSLPELHMAWEQAKDYAASVRSLQKKYDGKIQILLGFEAEYLPQVFERQQELCRELQADYQILGQHFLTAGDLSCYAGQKTEEEKRLTRYVDTVLEGLETGAYRYLCHPDLIHFVGDPKIYRREMLRLCRQIRKLGYPLEINLLGLGEGRHYPNEAFWAIAGEVGNPVILGMDAHDPAQLTNESVWEKGLALAKKYQLRVVDNIF